MDGGCVKPIKIIFLPTSSCHYLLLHHSRGGGNFCNKHKYYYYYYYYILLVAGYSSLTDMPELIIYLNIFTNHLRSI
jgi:hypothetical protein